MSEYGDNTRTMTASMPAIQQVGNRDKHSSTGIPAVLDYDIIGNTGHTYMVFAIDPRGSRYSIKAFNTMTEAKAAVAELKACPACAAGRPGPNHFASPLCRCGGSRHCSCNACW